MGTKRKDWGQGIKNKGNHSNPQKNESCCIFTVKLLLAQIQCKIEAGFAAQVPTANAGVVMRLEASCCLLIQDYNTGSNTAMLNPFSPAPKRMPAS